MKVLHINCNYIYTRLHNLLAERLIGLGADVRVYSPVVYGAKGVIEPDSDRVIVSECFNKRDRYVFDYKQKKIIKDAESKIKVGDFDIIHAHTLFSDGNAAMYFHKKYGIPYMVAVRDTDVNAFFKKAFYLRKRGVEIMENAAAVFFLSVTYKDAVLEQYVPKEKRAAIEKKCRIIPNGIDDFWLENIATDRDNSVFLENFDKKILRPVYVGAVSKRKNVVTTLKALELLRQKGWDIEFTVIGKDEDAEQMEAVRADKHTSYEGPKKKEEIIGYLKKADIFIMPSVTETFGLSYAEAVSQGVPVIYSKGQGFDGQFEEGEVGYHVDCFSAEEIAGKIEKITEDYARISLNCTKGALKFNWQDISAEYMQLYEQVCKG